jgi:hypothetical protein
MSGAQRVGAGAALPAFLKLFKKLLLRPAVTKKALGFFMTATIMQ